MSATPSGTRVLVVEDDPHLAAGVMEKPARRGYQVSTAGDGEQALAWLGEQGCALIVLDVMLPGIDGFGVCRALREQGNNTPVLFLTARGDPVDRVRGLESGGDDYLAKPFHLQEFLLRVRAILRPLGLVSQRLRHRGHRGAALRRQRSRLPRVPRPRLERGGAGAHREGGDDPQGARRARRRDRLARGSARARLGLRRVPLDPHRGQLHPAAAQAL